MALNNPAAGNLVKPIDGTDGKILVVVQLAGGNDGLSTVVPHGDDLYYQRSRPAIGIDAKTVLKINNYVGLHPNLTAMKDLYDSGHLGIVQGVGYPNPNRSTHFRSTDIWSSAQPDRDVVSSGWVGRYFDNACPGCDPKIGVAIGGQLPLTMQGEHVMPLSIEQPEARYRYQGRDRAVTKN